MIRELKFELVINYVLSKTKMLNEMLILFLKLKLNSLDKTI